MATGQVDLNAVAILNGKTYQVSRIEGSYPRAEADLRARGWDGYSYALTGKRGATRLAYRSAATGELHIVAGA